MLDFPGFGHRSGTPDGDDGITIMLRKHGCELSPSCNLLINFYIKSLYVVNTSRCNDLSWRTHVKYASWVKVVSMRLELIVFRLRINRNDTGALRRCSFEETVEILVFY